MLRGEFDAASADDPADLLRGYGAVIEAAVRDVGVEGVLEATGLGRSTVEAAGDGDVEELSLADAAAIVGSHPDRPAPSVIEADARDVLLLGMTTAVVDVDTLASSLDGVMEPKEIQQKLEGRHPMTLGEYATIHFQLREHTD